MTSHLYHRLLVKHHGSKVKGKAGLQSSSISQQIPVRPVNKNQEILRIFRSPAEIRQPAMKHAGVAVARPNLHRLPAPPQGTRCLTEARRMSA